MWGEGSPALLHRGHLSHPRGGGEARSDAAAQGFVRLGWESTGRARPSQRLHHQLAPSIPHHPSSISIPIFLPFTRLGVG